MKHSRHDKTSLRRQAFSLFELALVLAIITTLAAIAVPRFAESTARYRADMAARRIITDLSLAKSRAKTLSASQTVLFSVTYNRYQIPSLADLKDSSAVYTVNLADPPYGATLVEVVTADDDGQIVFDGWGTPNSAATLTVSVGDEVRAILLDPDTGKASVQ